MGAVNGSKPAGYYSAIFHEARTLCPSGIFLVDDRVSVVGHSVAFKKLENTNRKEPYFGTVSKVFRKAACNYDDCPFLSHLHNIQCCPTCSGKAKKARKNKCATCHGQLKVYCQLCKLSAAGQG